jgi:hypothetical protein
MTDLLMLHFTPQVYKSYFILTIKLEIIIYGSPLFRVDIITKTNAGKLKKHLIHKE